MSREPESEADDEADDDSLRPLRSVWLSMRDEEPPDGGMTALMAAARQQADVMRPTPSRWARALAALRRPPALALAGVAVLVSGALVLGTRHEEMSAPTRPAAEPELHAPAAEPERAPPLPPTPAIESPPLAVAPAPVVKRPRALERKSPPTKATQIQRAAPKADANPAPGGAAELASDATIASGAAVPAPGKSVAPASTIAKQAERAAARGDCAATRTETRKLAAVDRDALVARNAAVARCLR